MEAWGTSRFDKKTFMDFYTQNKTGKQLKILGRNAIVMNTFMLV